MAVPKVQNNPTKQTRSERHIFWKTESVEHAQQKT